MRGFLSILLVLACLLVLSREVALYAELSKGQQEVKTQLIRQQRIAEEIYSTEDGFAMTARDALRKYLLTPDSRKNEKDAVIAVCGALRKWSARCAGCGFEAAYVDPHTYGVMLPSACEEVLAVDFKERAVKFGDSFLAKIPDTKKALVFRKNVSGTEVTTLIPEGMMVWA
jgi:hypothetical protein